MHSLLHPMQNTASPRVFWTGNRTLPHAIHDPSLLQSASSVTAPLAVVLSKGSLMLVGREHWPQIHLCKVPLSSTRIPERYRMGTQLRNHMGNGDYCWETQRESSLGPSNGRCHLQGVSKHVDHNLPTTLAQRVTERFSSKPLRH